jgi:phosphoribosyl 1,2-cyclic phosphate phosphodiesterase
MPKMKIEILGSGTSQGVPVIGCGCAVCSNSDPRDDRLRSSAWIHSADLSLVIDTGPDFRQQMIRHSVNRVDAVLMTHGHADHIMGLDDLRTFNFLQNSSIPIYAYGETLDDLTQKFSYAFGKSDYPGVPQLEAREVTREPISVGSVKIFPIKVEHGNQRVMGIRIGDMAYITDANKIPESAMDQLIGIKILILNALRKEPHHSHFTLSEAVNIMKVLHVEKGYLTHISHLMGQHADVEQELPPNIRLAYDGLVLEFEA